MAGMALFISHRLARLIKQRAYASGEVALSAKQVDTLRLHLTAAEEILRAAEHELAAIDTEIEQVGAGIDVQAIASRRRTPRRMTAQRGTFLGEIIQRLQGVTEPIPLHKLASHVAEAVGLPMNTASQRNYAQERVRRDLNKLKARGIVARADNTASPTGRSIGCWTWVGL